MEIEIDTKKRIEIVDITSDIEEKIDINEGICNVFVPHTTSGITINESEPRLLNDIKSLLEEIVTEEKWDHNEIDDNADAHLRSILLESNLSIPIKNQNLRLGSWQSILFFEGDGPRKRKVIVKTLQ